VRDKRQLLRLTCQADGAMGCRIALRRVTASLMLS